METALQLVDKIFPVSLNYVGILTLIVMQSCKPLFPPNISRNTVGSCKLLSLNVASSIQCTLAFVCIMYSSLNKSALALKRK